MVCYAVLCECVCMWEHMYVRVSYNDSMHSVRLAYSHPQSQLLFKFIGTRGKNVLLLGTAAADT